MPHSTRKAFTIGFSSEVGQRYILNSFRATTYFRIGAVTEISVPPPLKPSITKVSTLEKQGISALNLSNESSTTTSNSKELGTEFVE